MIFFILIVQRQGPAIYPYSLKITILLSQFSKWWDHGRSPPRSIYNLIVIIRITKLQGTTDLGVIRIYWPLSLVWSQGQNNRALLLPKSRPVISCGKYITRIKLSRFVNKKWKWPEDLAHWVRRPAACSQPDWLITWAHMVGRRDLTSTSCPLATACTPWYPCSPRF